MRNKRLVTVILGLISALTGQLLWTSPANAADFRFLVPYRFEGIHPSVNWIQIDCRVWSDDGESIGYAYSRANLTAIPLSESGYKSVSGMATILVQLAPDADPAARWGCLIGLIDYTQGDGTVVRSPPTPTGTVEEVLYRDGSNIDERGNF